MVFEHPAPATWTSAPQHMLTFWLDEVLALKLEQVTLEIFGHCMLGQIGVKPTWSLILRGANGTIRRRDAPSLGGQRQPSEMAHRAGKNLSFGNEHIESEGRV